MAHNLQGPSLYDPEHNPAARALLTKGTEPVQAVVVGQRSDALAAVAGVQTGDQVMVAVEPTQVRKPWRATVRTLFQAVVALATLVPFIVTGVYDADDYPVVVGQVLTASGIVTRVMALPQVNDFLARFLPWLSAAGR